MSARSSATVEALIDALEQAGRAPTIARNYASFPHIGRDLDIFLSGGAGCAQSVFEQVAERLEWDFLTVCSHYQHVLCYRFHRLDPAETLPVDVIGGLFLRGQPLASADALCASRTPDASKRFCHMDAVAQNGWRLLQIESLTRALVVEPNKIARYRRRVLEHGARHEGTLASWALRNDLRGIDDALDALRAEEYRRFARLVRRAKRGFLARRLMENPSRTTLRICGRGIGRLREAVLDPCGPVLVLNRRGRDGWERVLDRLVETRFLKGWTTSRPMLRERGCAMVSFAVRGRPFEDRDASFDALARAVIERHRLLFSRAAVSGTPLAGERH